VVLRIELLALGGVGLDPDPRQRGDHPGMHELDARDQRARAVLAFFCLWCRLRGGHRPIEVVDGG
jgi:hypothetical protein